MECTAGKGIPGVAGRYGVVNIARFGSTNRVEQLPFRSVSGCGMAERYYVERSMKIDHN